jgi:uridine kinase
MTGFGTAAGTIHPDFFFADLLEAASFIIQDPYQDNFKELKHKVESFKKRPVIIAVAGNSRSGKTNFVSYLNLSFRNNDYKVLTIDLDNWILPESERKHCKNVYDRFQGMKIENDIARLLDGEVISLQSYANHPLRVSQSIEYRFQQEDIVIIDGIVSLGLYKVRQMTDIRIFMDIDLEVLRDRLHKYYSWRQKGKDEIEALFQKRKTDEYLLIEKDRKFADFIINAL